LLTWERHFKTQGSGNRYLGINIISGEKVAIKLESVKAKHPQLEYAKFTKRLPMVLESLSCAGLVPNVIIMRFSSIFGPSLEDLFNFCNRKFSVKAVLLLADQLVRGR
jgi:hypothetical protein